MACGICGHATLSVCLMTGEQYLPTNGSRNSSLRDLDAREEEYNQCRSEHGNQNAFLVVVDMAFSRRMETKDGRAVLKRRRLLAAGG